MLDKRLRLLLTLLGISTVALICTSVWRARAPRRTDPAHELRALAARISARPSAFEPRVELARFFADQGLNYGMALELSVLPPSAPLDSRIAAGAAFESLGLLEDAATVYRQLARESPSPPLLAALLRTLRDQGKFSEALSVVEAALARNADDQSLQRERIRCLLDTADYTRVIETVEPRLLAQPEDAELRLFLAWARLLRGEPAEALILLRGLPPEPVNAWAEVLRGRSHLELGRPQDVREALAAFQRAVEADPQLFEAHLGIADARMRGGDFTRTTSAAYRAVELQPHDPRPWEILARGYAGVGKPAEASWCRGCAALAMENADAAVPHLRKAVAAQRDSRFAIDLARALFAQGNARSRQEAFTILEREGTREPDPELLRFWYNRAFELGGAGQVFHRETLKAAELLASDPRPRIAAEGHALRGQLLRQRGDWRASEAALTEALARAPNDPALLGERARTRLASRQDPTMLAGAEADLRIALAADGQIPPVHHDMAEVQMQRRLWPEALLSLLREATLMRDQGPGPALRPMIKALRALEMEAEALWCERKQQTVDLSRKQWDDALVERRRSATETVELSVARSALAVNELVSARAAYLRLTRLAPGKPDHWEALGEVSQRMGLYDQRVAAMQRWRSLRSRSGAARPAP